MQQAVRMQQDKLRAGKFSTRPSNFFKFFYFFLDLRRRRFALLLALLRWLSCGEKRRRCQSLPELRLHHQQPGA